MKSNKSLTLFGMFALTASMLMSADEYPAFAVYGLQAIVLLVIAGIVWFIPVALCSAELATIKGYEDGGVFSWVGKTLGERFGFIAIFFQWLQVTVNFITMIYFIIGALTYVIGFDEMNTNPLVKSATFVALYWAATFVQLKGIDRTSQIVKICFIVGIVIPSIVQVVLAIAYVADGGTIVFDTSLSSAVPSFGSFSGLVAILPFILAFSGIEASASHINEMAKPRRDYPIVLFLLVFFAIILDSLGGLSIATVIPPDQLSLNQGVIQALGSMLGVFFSDPTLIVKTIAILMALGMFGEISSWIVGPVRGLYYTAHIGILPKFFNRENKNGVPLRFVVVQGIIVSVIGTTITFLGGSGNASFQVAISLTIMVYMVTYILIFISYIKVTYGKNKLERGFQIGGGKVVKTAIASLGLVSSIVVFILTFIPHSSSGSVSSIYYTLVLGAGFVVVFIFVNLIYRKKASENTRFKHFMAHHVNRWTYPKARGEFYWDT